MGDEKPISLIVVTSDGKEWPGWALRAGFTITATEYDHDERRMKAWLSEESVNRSGRRCPQSGGAEQRGLTFLEIETDTGPDGILNAADVGEITTGLRRIEERFR